MRGAAARAGVGCSCCEEGARRGCLGQCFAELWEQGCEITAPRSGPSKPQGPVALAGGASTALPKVASGVERLQIIFMGDNKNVLPHNQHKTVATVSFSLKQHVLNEHSADKCCKSSKGMHRIIQYALL